MKVFSRLIELLSGEVLLTRCRLPNGGTVVLVRAFVIALVLFTAGLAIVNILDPRRGGPFSGIELRIQIIDHAKWWGALFGSAYVALYTRFASQWAYLAGVYNQIKAAEALNDHDEDAVAEWFAAFIEDCDELHLVRKPMFASIVNGQFSYQVAGAWKVCEIFDQHAPGGQLRRERITLEVAAVVANVQREYAARAVRALRAGR